MHDCAKVFSALERHRLLLQQDKILPSVVGLITGEALSGSWWSHPRAQKIFYCLNALIDRKDVLMTRLISKKITYVHRSLWPAFLAVATSREKWQTAALTPAARALLRRVETGAHVEATGPAARELQDRLLVHAAEVHTAQGKHALVLKSWREASERIELLPAGEARSALEDAATAIGAAAKTLPWNRTAR